MQKTIISMIIVIFALNAKAEVQTITGQDDVQVNVSSLGNIMPIPQTYDLSGKVVSIYQGSTHGLWQYIIEVGNTAARCEADDCVAQKFFLLDGFTSPVQTVYSRQIDNSTYSIAVVGTKITDFDDNGMAIQSKVITRLKVKFTPTTVEATATTEDEIIK